MNPGTKLGPYQITGQLGAGGMGEVYRATDTRLNRTVAIKVLPEHLASDPQRRVRFEREAKAVSSLNHPHICTLHDVGEQDGAYFLVMELVEGETLETRLQRGRLPLDKALEYAIQIADALDKAHRQGVVHRDLKPANIMLTKSGVKLLDFGLAKLKGDAGAASPMSQMPTQDAGLTAEGTILGTLQYMAPEQLQGQDADARTDIFAFGAVVYEMVTGKKAFEGKSQASLIHAIMGVDPQPMVELQEMTPRGLDRTVRQCLEKDPDDRWQTAGDLKREATWIAGLGTESNVATATSMRRIHMAWASAVGVAVLVAIGSTAMWIATSSERSSVEWSTILPPSASGISMEPALSPDGQSVVFRGSNALGETTLWVRSFTSATARELPGTQGATQPFWSSDGRSLGFFTSAGELKRVDISSGDAQVLASASNPRGGDWNQNGTIIFAPTGTSGLYTISASGGQAVRVTRPDQGHWHENPHFLPDGRHFLFSQQESARVALYVGSLDSSEVQHVADIRSRAEYSNGFLFFGDGNTLYAQEFDTERFELHGGRHRVAGDLGLAFGWLGAYAFSIGDQRLIYAHGGPLPDTQLVAFDREGRNLGSIGPPGEIYGFALAPDEESIALEKRDRVANTVDISLMNVTNGLPTLFASGAPWMGVPLWSPASDRVLFTNFFNTYFIKNINGGKVEEVRVAFGAGGWPDDWSSDGKYVSVSDQGAETANDVWIVSLSGGDPPRQYLHSRANEFESTFAPDVRWIAYSSDESGAQYEIYVQAFPEGGKKQRISTHGGRHPTWRSDGRELYYISSDQKLVAARVSESPLGLVISSRTELFDAPELIDETRPQYAVMDNGKRFIFNAIYKGGEPRSMTVVKNWKSLLEEDQ